MVEGNATALILLSAAAVFLFITAGFAFFYTMRYGARARLQERAEAVIGAGGTVQGHRSAGENPRRRVVKEKIREMEDATRNKPRRKNVLQRELRQANISMPIKLYFTLSAVLGLVVAAIAFVYFGGLQGSRMAILFGMMAGLVAWIGIPRWIVKFVGRRRQKKFIRYFADSVDIIVRGLQSGLPVDECLNIIAQEAEEPVRSEFRTIVDGLRFGLTLEQALHRAYDRMPVAELKFFTISLSIQRQTGGNLAETLKNLSTVLRDRHKLRAIIRAVSSEARASAWILGSLPFVITGMLFLVGQNYIVQLFTDPLGHVMVAVALFMLGIGAAVMRKMVNFEI